MNPVRQTVLGAFFFSTLFLLGFLTIYLGEWNPFETKTQYEVFFDDVDGLRAGDPVLVYGVQQGRILAIDFTGDAEPQRRLRATFYTDRPLTLNEDYTVGIKDQSLLGGKRVEIEQGEGASLAAGTELFGSSRGDLLTALNDVVDENRTDLNRILSNAADIAESVALGKRSLSRYLLDEPAVEDLNSGISSLRQLGNKLDSGEGALGQLINESEAYDSLLSVLNNGSNVMSELAAGEGTLGRLIREPEMFHSLQAPVDSLRTTATRVEGGEGALGWLSSSASNTTVAKVEQAVDDLAAMTAQVRRGEGVLGKLVFDPELGQKIDSIAANLDGSLADIRTLVADMKSGEGTLGLLLAEPEARKKVERILDQVANAIEDAREAAPVSSVASFLFGNL
jgi:phospholipid/cholesterol/gamma-HCH transport system substrate-binding protein